MRARSQERAAFVAALQDEVVSLGRFAENQGTAQFECIEASLASLPRQRPMTS